MFFHIKTLILLLIFVISFSSNAFAVSASDSLLRESRKSPSIFQVAETLYQKKLKTGEFAVQENAGQVEKEAEKPVQVYDVPQGAEHKSKDVFQKESDHIRKEWEERLNKRKHHHCGHDKKICGDHYGSEKEAQIKKPVVKDQKYSKNTQIKTLSTDNEKAVYNGYRLGAGDKVRITVFGENDLSGEYMVSETGVISFPLVGEFNVKNLTVSQTREQITGLLKDGYLKDPDIVIEITEFRPFYVLGEVREPGSYDYVVNMTVLNAVAVAGGFTYRAEQDEVNIMRSQGEEQTKLLEDVAPESKVVPGDIIVVKERFF